MVKNHRYTPLYSIPFKLKAFLLAFLFLLTWGVTTGIGYLYHTTGMSAGGAVEHYRGSDYSEAENFAVVEKYQKSLGELLLTTHNHLIGFSFIFFLLGIIFYFSTVVNERIKYFLMAEPFISVWMTFSSIWGVRFWHQDFVFLSVIFGIITYLSFYTMVGLLVYELVFIRSK